MKVSFYDTTYYINEEKKTVTCKTYYTITGNQRDLIKYMAYITNNPIDTLVSYSVATAHLSDGDTWDVEVGKKVARAKAETKAYECIAKTFRASWPMAGMIFSIRSFVRRRREAVLMQG